MLKEDKYKSSYRVPSGCAVFGIANEERKLFNGSMVIEGIEMMHDRSNGLGGGFAAYGIYPDYKDDYAFHMFFDDTYKRKETEDYFRDIFKISYSENIPTKKTANINKEPIIARYFLKPKEYIYNINEEDSAKEGFKNIDLSLQEEEFVAKFVTDFNAESEGAFIVSSGKDMGIFKGVGYPEEIGHFYRLDEYDAYIWTSHGRFPTNSSGWWGGAHPFGFLNWSVVHNGEISSYGTNKRFVNDYGYKCAFSTDTEVLAYLVDLLVRKHKINLTMINFILAAPLWDEIEILPENIKEFLKTLRIIYARALVNGPFSIIVGNTNFMYALNDRIKLRPLVAAKKYPYTFVSSEESAIKKVCPNPDVLWNPRGGEPVITFIKGDNKMERLKSELSSADFLDKFAEIAIDDKFRVA